MTKLSSLGQEPTFKIINLSRRQLDDIEKCILRKELNVIPALQRPNSQEQELKEDLAGFIRKVRLIEYFDGEENNDVSLVRNKGDLKG